MELVLKTYKKEETKALGMKIAKVLEPGFVLTLDGDLGAGKTTLTQGIGKGLGIDDNINSPTFNILKCYFVGRLPLYHIDAYRLEDHINDDIGLEEVIQGDGVCVIEWSHFIENMIFEPLKIVINRIDDNTREFIFSSNYSKYEKVFEVLRGE